MSITVRRCSGLIHLNICLLHRSSLWVGVHLDHHLDSCVVSCGPFAAWTLPANTGSVSVCCTGRFRLASGQDRVATQLGVIPYFLISARMWILRGPKIPPSPPRTACCTGSLPPRTAMGCLAASATSPPCCAADVGCVDKMVLHVNRALKTPVIVPMYTSLVPSPRPRHAIEELRRQTVRSASCSTTDHANHPAQQLPCSSNPEAMALDLT